MSEFQPTREIAPIIQYDQSDKIRELEERLTEMDKKLAQIIADREDEGSTASTTNNEDVPNPKAKDNNGRPSAPLTVPEVHKVDVYHYSYHLLPTETFPAIEAAIQTTRESNVTMQFPSYKDTLLGLSSTQLMEKLTSTNVVSKEETYGLLKFRINSARLTRLLLSVLCKHDAADEQKLCFTRPYRVPIYYHEDVKRKVDELERLKESEKQGNSSSHFGDRELLLELQCYVRFMEHDIIPFYSRFDTLSASDNAKVHFRDLWHLFKPGETILYPRATSTPSAGDYDKLYRSRRADQKLWRIYSRKTENDIFWVKAYCIDYDGENFLCVKEFFEIPKYEFFTAIDSLPVFPLRFASNSESIMENATKYGQKFLNIIGEKLMTHDGWASEPHAENSIMRYVKSDVVIDMIETFRTYPDWKPVCKLPSTSYRGSRGDSRKEPGCLNWCWHDGKKVHINEDTVHVWDEEQIPREEKRLYCHKTDKFLASWLDDNHGPATVSTDDFHLLPRRLFAYSLQDRMFLAVDVSNLEPVEDRRAKSNDLIIKVEHKKMLHAVMKSHFEEKKVRSSSDVPVPHQDIVHNKGRGLIILLHGVPGVGKTSTAETIASEFERPLLPITCGDLGLDPATVEKSLKQMFRAAQLWDCILLLDEAEVFLAERIPSDLSRNALVSVFLRVLDYYDGVLFLTTNRVGSIDEAFKSRIHVSLYYPHLTKKQTEKIWEVNLLRLISIEKEKEKMPGQKALRIDWNGIMDYATEHFESNEQDKGRWNGRQIRNAFLIASALARYDKSSADHGQSNHYDLNTSHFKTVAKTGVGFEKYLIEAKGRPDTEIAWAQGFRADHFRLREKEEKENDVDDAHERNARNAPLKRSQSPAPGLGLSSNDRCFATQPFATTRHGVHDDGFFSPSQNAYASIPLQPSQYVPNMVNVVDRPVPPTCRGFGTLKSTAPIKNPAHHGERTAWSGGFDDSEEE